MKKIIFILFLLCNFISFANAGYYYDGASLGMCQQVDGYNPQNTTFRGFWPYPIISTGDTTYVREYDSQHYAVRTLIIGYPTSPHTLAKLDGQFLESDISYIICNTSQFLQPSAVGAVSYGQGSFYGGRSQEWLIPKKALQPGDNDINFDLEGLNVTLTLKVN